MKRFLIVLMCVCLVLFASQAFAAGCGRGCGGGFGGGFGGGCSGFGGGCGGYSSCGGMMMGGCGGYSSCGSGMMMGGCGYSMGGCGMSACSSACITSNACSPAGNCPGGSCPANTTTEQTDVPPAPAPTAKPSTLIPTMPPSPKDQTTLKLTLKVPENAVVIVNGRPTQSKGMTREYFAKVSPDQNYRFRVQVDGQEKTLLISSGEHRVENFMSPAVVLTGQQK